MFNPIKPINRIQPSIHALGLLGPRAMSVIDRNRSISSIAAYEATLGPKVVRLDELRTELLKLVDAYKTVAGPSAAEIDALDDVVRVWSAHLQLNTSLEPADIGITDSRTPEAILDNAWQAMKVLREHGELPFAAQALSEIESKHSSAKAAYDAKQAGRVAVQATQRELQAVAASIQKELVKLRVVARIALGPSHIDYQRLRVVNGRVLDVADESAPETAESSPASDSGSPPSTTG